MSTERERVRIPAFLWANTGRMTPPRQTPLGQTLPPPQGDTPPRQTPPPPSVASDIMGYGQQAGGTHPTGMHSCFKSYQSPPR